MSLKKKIAKILGLTRTPLKLPPTVTYYSPGHFYSPLPNLEDFKDSLNPVFDTSLKELPGINLNAEGQFRLLNELLPNFRQFSDGFTKSIHSGTTRFNFDQYYFKEADALALYGFLSYYKPKKVIEVGSGHSSALMLDTADTDPTWQPQITFIEPYPDRLHSVLKENDKARTNIIQKFVQNVPIEDFLALNEGDILFIDSSHVSKIGSDVNFLFFDVLPRLKPGVIIHIHDIFWPFEYPHEWIMEGRAWNEDYLLRALLIGSDMFEIVFWNSWMGFAGKEILEKECSLFMENTGGSIYLRKTR
jgi:predicted O-methyltransferase YrrM